MLNDLPMHRRFNGYLPVIIDVETGGVVAATDALLEIGVSYITLNEEHRFVIGESDHFHVEPFPKAKISEASLKITGIRPHHPFRFAQPEQACLESLFKKTREQLKAQQCNRAVLVGHNAHFDLGFLRAAQARCGIEKSPYHHFTCFDTATLGAVMYGHSVLARALKAAGISFDKSQAHSARYDAEKTAELFCTILNRLQTLPMPAT
jgi:ribonuclease T